MSVSDQVGADAAILFYSPRERLREIMMAGLVQCGYRVTHTSSPYSAVLQATQSPPDLILVDITRENAKGLLIVTALGRAPRTAGLPMVLMVPAEPQGLLPGLKEEYEAHEIDTRPSVHTIQYPFHFSSLVAEIRNGLSG